VTALIDRILQMTDPSANIETVKKESLQFRSPELHFPISLEINFNPSSSLFQPSIKLWTRIAIKK
jgi:hypothetical protein